MDKYDKAIEYLTANPNHIPDAWLLMPRDHFSPDLDFEPRCLFEYVAKDPFSNDTNEHIGCLTQIRANAGIIAETPELTEAIRADERIPRGVGRINVDNLHVFAEWQRRIDTELGRPV